MEHKLKSMSYQWKINDINFYGVSRQMCKYTIIILKITYWAQKKK